MAQQQINTIIVLRNDETTAWESTSYRLLKGEVGIGRTSYVKDGETINNVVVKVGDGTSAWSNLPQIEGVLEEELVLTHNFGRHKTTNGKVNAGGEGMTVSQWLRDALSEVLNPIVTYPTASFVADGYVTDTGTNEIGSRIKTIKWKTTVGVGSYKDNNNGVAGSSTYGSSNSATSSATGISKTNVSWTISNQRDDASVSKTGETTGSFTLAEDKYIQINSTSSKTYTKFDATATIDASSAYIPLNNLGVQYAAGQIKGFDKNGTTTKSFNDVAVNATGFRNSWYYVGTDCTTTIDSAFVRKATSKGANTTSFGSIKVPNGTKRFMIAVPGTHTLTDVVDVNGMGLHIQGDFTTKTVQVEGANGYTAADYSVFVYENSNGTNYPEGETYFTITIS